MVCKVFGAKLGNHQADQFPLIVQPQVESVDLGCGKACFPFRLQSRGSLLILECHLGRRTCKAPVKKCASQIISRALKSVYKYAVHFDEPVCQNRLFPRGGGGAYFEGDARKASRWCATV